MTDQIAGIPEAEYGRRRRRCMAAAAQRGLDAVLAWSRGGGPVDRYASVLYLTGFYPQYPVLADFPPLWASRGQAGCLLTLAGDATLLTDLPLHPSARVAASAVRVGSDPLAETIALLKERGLAQAPVGLAGADAMSATNYRRLVAALPDLTIVEIDDLLADQRLVKSPAEIAIIRHACAIGCKAVEAAMEGIRPGVTEAQAVAPAAQVIVAGGGAIIEISTTSGPDASAYTCGRVACRDTSRPLREGDMFRLDVYGVYEGYYFDFGRGAVVGGRATGEQAAFLQAMIDAVDVVIGAIRPEATASQVTRAGLDYLGRPDVRRAAGIPADHHIGPFFGHGLGLDWERPWLVPEDSTVIQAGMFLAVEKRVSIPGRGEAFFEEDLLVTDGGTETLTPLRRIWW